jgi:hypothetical protein
VAFDGSFVVRLFTGGLGRANAVSGLNAESDPELSAHIARIEVGYEAQRLSVRCRSTPQPTAVDGGHLGFRSLNQKPR